MTTTPGKLRGLNNLKISLIEGSGMIIRKSLNHLSNEKNPGCLVYIRDYTTQIMWGLYYKYYKESLLNNPYFMESKAEFFSWLICLS